MKEIEIACPLGQEPSAEQIVAAAARAMGVAPKAVSGWRIVRRSIDARGEILYRYRVEAYRSGEEILSYSVPEYRDVSSAEPVIIVGAGPAGMFAALHLLMRGLRPVILERGKDVHARKADMAMLSREGSSWKRMRICLTWRISA